MNQNTPLQASSDFVCKQFGGPENDKFVMGEPLMFMQYRGDEYDCVLFCRSTDAIQAAHESPEHPEPNPKYEMDRASFERLTSRG